jgi:hypothetical protein
MADKYNQKSGDGSQQLQISTFNVTQGIDEKRVREICSEMIASSLHEYTDEARNIGEQRIAMFNSRLIERVTQVEGALEMFRDPSVCVLLKSAQQASASTEREKDYDLLTELLIHRFQKGADRHIRTGINHAVKIVDEISDESLLGLTVLHSVKVFLPVTGDVLQGIDVLENLFNSVIYGALPVGNDWLEHLDVLGAIRLSDIGYMKKIAVVFPERLDGYVSPGIEANSEDYRKSIEILRKGNLSAECLKKHPLIADRLRLEVSNRNAIATLTPQQNAALSAVYDLYSSDPALKRITTDNFMVEWDKRPHLKILHEWWDNLEHLGKMATVTVPGRALAHANAQRCDPKLPALH